MTHWARAAIQAVVAVAALAHAAEPAAADAADDAALVHEGRALYRGDKPFRQPAQLHGVPLPGVAACAQCHGPRGEPRNEAGVAVPGIQWRTLTQTRPARAAYDEAGLLRALSDGRRAGGQALAAPMPRYTFDAGEARALVAWLRVMGTEAAPVPGVTHDRIVLGSVLPLSGPQAPAGRAVHEAMNERIAHINASGGIFGRQLTLEVADIGPDAAQASATAARLVQSGRVMALVGSFVPEPDAALRAALVTHELPMLATLGQPTSAITDPRITWLLPSLAQQVTALANALPQHCEAAKRNLRVLAPARGPLAALAQADKPTPETAPAPRFITVDDLAALMKLLEASPQEPSLLLFPAPWVRQARETLGPHGACIGTLAVLSGGANSTVPGPPELMGLPMPQAQAQSPQPGQGLWTVLGHSAIAVAVEALSRSGRQTDGPRLGAAVDSLRKLPVASGLTVDFSPTRRHGFEPVQVRLP